MDRRPSCPTTPDPCARRHGGRDRRPRRAQPEGPRGVRDGGDGGDRRGRRAAHAGGCSPASAPAGCRPTLATASGPAQHRPGRRRLVPARAGVVGRRRDHRQVGLGGLVGGGRPGLDRRRPSRHPHLRRRPPPAAVPQPDRRRRPRRGAPGGVVPRRTPPAHAAGLVEPQGIVAAAEAGWWRMAAVVPAVARLRVDLRLVPGQSPLDAWRELDAALDELRDGDDPIDVRTGAGAGDPRQPHRPRALDLPRRRSARGRRSPAPATSRSRATSGATDANILRNRGIPTVRIGLPKAADDGGRARLRRRDEHGRRRRPRAAHPPPRDDRRRRRHGDRGRSWP